MAKLMKSLDLDKLQAAKDKLLSDIAGMNILIGNANIKTIKIVKVARSIAKKELKKIEKVLKNG